MGALERILGGIAETIKLNDRVAGMAGDVKDLAKELRDIDRRLVRVEAAVELLAKSGFAPPPLDVTPRPAAIDDKTAPRRSKHKK
jgi:hypothetical protein